MATMTKAIPGARSVFHVPTWVQKPRHLGHPLMLPSAIGGVLDWNWGSQHSNQCRQRLSVHWDGTDPSPVLTSTDVQ